MTAGLVVAGGYSMRFGLAEKGLVEIDGEPMLARVVGALETVVEDVVVDCRADQVAPFESALASSDSVDGSPTFAIDEEPDAGPIAGIANGLSAIVESGGSRVGDDVQPRETEAGEVLLVSCDRPGISPELLRSLSDRRRRHDVDVVLPAVDGYLQPLCGAYRVDALAGAVADARASGERRLLSVPASLSKQVVSERSLEEIVESSAVASVDTPLDAWVRSQAVLSRSAGGGHAVNGGRPDGPTVLAGD